MQVLCPGCKRAYKVDETKLPKLGRKMRCPKCSEVFVVTVEGVQPVSSLSSSVSPSPVSMSPSPVSMSPSPVSVSPPKKEQSSLRSSSPKPAEDDFSDIKIPSIMPERPVLRKSKESNALSSLPPLTQLPSLTPSPSLTPLPSISAPLELDTESLFSEQSLPPDNPVPISIIKDAVELASIAPPLSSLEIDDSFSDNKSDEFSIPPALQFPTSNDLSASFAKIPSLNPIQETFDVDNDDNLDFDPTLEKSGSVLMDDDAEFDLETQGNFSDSETPSFNPEEFGNIDFSENIPLPPKKEKPKASPPPLSQQKPPQLKQSKSAAVSVIPLSSEDVVSELSPNQFQTPNLLDDIPSPADLLNLGGARPSLNLESSRGSSFGTPVETASYSLPNASVLPVRSDKLEYGEVELPLVERTGSLDLDAEEFDAFPVESRGVRTTQTDLDLVAEPMDMRTEDLPVSESELDPNNAEEKRKRVSFEGRRKFERQSRRTRNLLLVLLVVLVGAGASLYFTPYGPFGANILFRLIPKPVNLEAISKAESSAAKKIIQDTYDIFSEVIRETEEVHLEYTTSDDLSFYMAYLCYMSQIRFGTDNTLDAKALKAIGASNLSESKVKNAKLAQASQYLRFSRPIPSDAAYIKALESTADGKVLLVYSHIQKHELQDAYKIASLLDTSEKSPRSGYLLATVYMKMKDQKSAEEAEKLLSRVLETQKKHVDAILLMAEAMLSQKKYDTVKVIALVNEALSACEGSKIPSAFRKAQGHAILAQMFIKDREYQKAEKEIEQAEKWNPENVSMLISKGYLALARKNLSSAAAAFSKAYGNEPKNIWAVLGKIETDILSGELAASKSALLEILPNNKDNARAHYLMGDVLAALKDTDEAEKELTTAVELDETLLEAYVSLSSIYMASKRNDEAMRILDQASVKVPGSPLIKKTLATGHAARGDWASAIVELDNALKIDPEDIEAHFQMATMYRKLNSLDDAKRAIAEVERRNPSYPGLAMEQGLLMEQTGDVASALSSYKKALSMSPDNLSLKLRVGVASFLAGDRENAEKLLAEVIEKQPLLPEANFYYGETFRVSKRAAEAVGYLQKACDLARDNSLYQLRYGTALEEVRDTERAVSAFQTAIKLDPKNAEAYVGIGRIKLKRGSVRDATEYLEKGLSIDDSLGHAYLALAQAYEQLSNMPAALKNYRKAAEKDSNNAEAHYRLGLAELQVNGKAASLDGFSKSTILADKMEPKPGWFFEALYRRGVAERARGLGSQAIASFKRFIEEAPENHIDRSEVLGNLRDMGQ